MSELDDRLGEGREAVATMGPPEDLWARVVSRSNSDDAAILDLAIVQHRPPRRTRRYAVTVAALAACALTVMALAAVLAANRRPVDTSDPAGPVSSTTTTDAADDDSTRSTTAGVVIARTDGNSELWGQTLDVTAVERDGEVTGEFRLGDGIVVRIQCADTRGFGIGESTRRDLILGGQVIHNADGVATVDSAGVAVGDPVALIIREDLPALGQRITLYEPSLWHGEQATAESCDDLVASVPLNIDGGFFDRIQDAIQTLDVVTISEIQGDSVFLGQTLNVSAVERDGEVTGEFRLGDDIVVRIQCADTRGFGIGESTRRDLVLVGQVIHNADGVATVDGAGVAVGDLVALIIREEHPALGQRVTLYEPSRWHGEQATAESCSDLVASFPDDLDDGLFDDVVDGIEAS